MSNDMFMCVTVEEEKKRRLEVEKQLAALQAEQKATQAAATQSDLKKSDESKKAKEETKDEMLKVQAREAEKEKLFNAQQKQHKVSPITSHHCSPSWAISL